MILDLKSNHDIAQQNFKQKNMEFAMPSRLFYPRTVHRKPSSEAHSNVVYYVIRYYILNVMLML